MEIKRYDIEESGMVENRRGNYVEYVDYKNEVDDLQFKIDTLKENIANAKSADMRKGKQTSKIEFPWIYKLLAFLYWLEGFKVRALSNIRLITNSAGTILSAILFDTLTLWDDIRRPVRELNKHLHNRALQIYEQMKEGAK